MARILQRAQAGKPVPRGARKVLRQLFKRHRMGLVTSGDCDRVEGQLRGPNYRDYFGHGSVEGNGPEQA